MAAKTVLKLQNVLVLMLLVAAACTPQPVENLTPAPISATVTWLKANAIPLQTTQPGAGSDDLLPLKALIGDADVVALGEATHGTHEFFQMKHRLLQFLVERMGFRAFALEANWPEADLINTYVRTGKGNPRELLRGLHFWTWDTEEVLDMILWMRAYNQDRPASDQIGFYGFDMQFDTLARSKVLDYLATVDPLAADEASDDYACYPQLSVECKQALQRVFDRLSGHKAAYEARSSARAFADALHSARLVIQSKAYASQEQDFYLRDRFMAENVEWILTQAAPAAKMVLWAHNMHIATLGDQAHPTMGDILRKDLGARMVTVGFLFGEGSFNAYGPTQLETFQVDRPPAGSYEHLFQSAGIPIFLLDMRNAASAREAGSWLLQSHPFRSIGAGYDPGDPQQGFWTAALAKAFDMVIYFQGTSPSRLLSK